MTIFVILLISVGIALFAAGWFEEEYLGMALGILLILMGGEPLIFGTWHVFKFAIGALALFMFGSFLLSTLS